jgi:hypothetical protein
MTSRMFALVGIACLAGALCPTPAKKTGHLSPYHLERGKMGQHELERLRCNRAEQICD